MLATVNIRFKIAQFSSLKIRSVHAMYNPFSDSSKLTGGYDVMWIVPIQYVNVLAPRLPQVSIRFPIVTETCYPPHNPHLHRFIYTASPVFHLKSLFLTTLPPSSPLLSFTRQPLLTS